MSTTTTSVATEPNLFKATRTFAAIGIMAMGMIAVIITGGIDLSVRSVMAVVAIVVLAILTALGLRAVT